MTELFGAPARLPLGPALLAIETGAPTYVTAVRRTTPGRYIGRLDRVDVAADGSRRERATATTASIARIFERVIGVAPEQWWAVFFPIGRTWPRRPLRASRPRPPHEDAGRRRPRRRVGRPLPAGPTSIHTVASDGIADVISIIEHVVARGELDVIAITDHERIDAASRADRSRAIAAFRSRSSSARR